MGGWVGVFACICNAWGCMCGRQVLGGWERRTMGGGGGGGGEGRGRGGREHSTHVNSEFNVKVSLTSQVHFNGHLRTAEHIYVSCLIFEVTSAHS